MAVSTHKRVLGITGANGAGSVSVTDTAALQDTVLTINCGNGIVIIFNSGWRFQKSMFRSHRDKGMGVAGRGHDVIKFSKCPNASKI